MLAVASILGSITNAIFTYLFVFGVWIFPDLGVPGAALGTVVAVVLEFALLLFIFLSRSLHNDYGTRRLDISRTKIWQIVRIGTPAGMQSCWQILLLLVFVWFLGVFGTDALAAGNIVNTCSQFILMPVIALSIMLGASVSEAIGKDDHERAEQLSRLGLSMAAMFTVVAGPLMVLLERPLGIHRLRAMTAFQLERLHSSSHAQAARSAF